MAKVTMQTIADLAGVTRTTISRVLHKPDQVSPQTREHVERILREQSYVYHTAAADLTRGRMSTIGLVLPTLPSSAFASTILKAQEAAQNHGMCMVIGSTGYNPESEARILQQFRERRLAGGILVGFCPSNEPLIRALEKGGVPVVVIWEKLDIEGISYVGFDNAAAAEEVTNHLIALGHRRIGLLLGPHQHSNRVAARLQGYRQALADSDIPYDAELVISSNPSMKDGEQGLRRLMHNGVRPSAIFAASDTLAIGALRGARRLGIRVPEDLALASFDGIDLGTFVTPELTTVKVPEHQMIWQAFKCLMEKISGSSRHCARCLKTRLVIRQSCGARMAGGK